MKKSFCLILSFLMILGSVLIAVPTANAADSAVYSMNAASQSVNGYDSLTEALEDTDSTITWYQLNTDLDGQNISRDVLLDLNGHSLTNVYIPAGVTLTGIDSATDDYRGEFGSVSGTVEGSIAATARTEGEVKSYVTVCEDGSYSFHRYYAAIAAISLKPSQAGLGYRAEFRGDDAVKNAVVNYGYELWVNDNAHKTYTRTDKLEKSSLSLRLKNILSQGNDTLNAIGSTATISGNAFVTLELNGEQITLTGTQQQTTLRQVIETINANAGTYGEAQLESVRELCTTYAPWMLGWATENIFGNGQGEGSDGLKVEIVVDVTAENNVMAQDATMSNSTVSAQVPQGALLDENTTQLVLTVSEKESSDSGVALAEDQTILPLDVHIQGISTDNTAPITVRLGAILPAGLNIGNYTLYHVENGEPVEMTYVDSVEKLAAHNEFFYEPATGDVTISVASFSEIALVSDDNNIWNGEIATSFSGGDGSERDPWLVANADQLAYMSKIVSDDAEYADDCYKLITDVDFGSTENSEGEVSIAHVFYPIGYWKQQEGTNSAGEIYYGRGNSFTGVFDGNGNTVANLYQNTWQMDGDYDNGYWKSAMGLFGACFNATIKNLTIKNFQSDGEFTPTGCVAAYAGGDMLFENIYLTDCNPRVYNTGNGGIVGLNYNSTSGTPDNITFRNITVDQTNKISALWGSWDVSCGGIMGRLRENSLHDSTQKNQVTFEYCHVAAIIDVNNDVCANYQYYQYRYSGMMIGTVDYINQVDTFGLEDVVDAERCTVTYGDWNEYWYCELVANSLASYTHDHQFSRLVKISSIDEISNDNGVTWKEKGNFVIPSSDNQSAECFHIVEQNGLLVRHTHDMSGTEVINGETILKEDRTCYFIPFGQLFAGYGYPAYPVYDVNGTSLDITITDLDSTTKSSQKFTENTTTNITSYVPETTIRVGDLFAENGIVDVSNSTVQVFVSPADDTSTTSGVYTADTSNWKNGTLVISGSGAAKITITDYFYCEPTTITIEVRLRRVYYAYADKVEYVDIETGSVTLPTAEGVVGWTETAIPEGSQTAPDGMLDPGDSFHVDVDTTLYAVYQSDELGYYTREEYCPHLNTSSSTTQQPTCTQTGTASITCNDCGDTVSSSNVPALGHSCQDGICVRCGGQFCGDNITWKLNEDTGVLTLTGTGSTWLYKDIKRSPFIKYVDKVTSVVIDEGITRIEEYLFYDMKNIESVQFPSTATAVTNRAFACCTSLKAITIPTSLNIIGAYTFRASGVSSVTFESTSYPKIVSPLDPFKYCNYTVYAPCSESWRTSSINWGGSCNGKILTHSFNEGTTTCTLCGLNYCGDQITWAFDEATGTLTLSGRGSTYDYYGKTLPYADLTDKITTIVVGEGITELNKNIFNGLQNVTSVQLPGSLQKIQSRALAGFTSLKELVVPANVITLGAYCFENCSQLNLYFLGSAPTNSYASPCLDGTYTLHIPCGDDTWTQSKLDALAGTCSEVVLIHNYVDGICSCGQEEPAA